MIPPIQEEKTTEEEQEDVEDEEEHCQLASAYLVSGNTSGNATPEQIAPRNGSPSLYQDATPPGGPNSNQHLTPVVSTKPKAATTEELWMFGPPPQQTPKQSSPTQSPPDDANPSSSPKQPVTPVNSTRPTTATGENTANGLPMQQNPGQPSPTQETQIALIVKPGSASTNKSESSGTNESKKGVVTGQKAVTKGKELKEVNETDDREAKEH